MRSSRPMSPKDDPIRHQRTGLGALLSILVALGYYGFLLAGAAVPRLLASPAIGSVPWSFLLGALLLVFTVVTTGLYTVLANAAEQRR